MYQISHLFAKLLKPLNNSVVKNFKTTTELKIFSRNDPYILASSTVACSAVRCWPPLPQSPSQAQLWLSNHHFSPKSSICIFFSTPARNAQADASSGSEAGPPLGQKSKRVAAFSAAAHRVAAPAALTEHRWLAKLSSHTTWKGVGIAHAPAGGRRSPSQDYQQSHSGPD